MSVYVSKVSNLAWSVCRYHENDPPQSSINMATRLRGSGYPFSYRGWNITEAIFGGTSVMTHWSPCRECPAARGLRIRSRSHPPGNTLFHVSIYRCDVLRCATPTSRLIEVLETMYLKTISFWSSQSNGRLVQYQARKREKRYRPILQSRSYVLQNDIRFPMVWSTFNKDEIHPVLKVGRI